MEDQDAAEAVGFVSTNSRRPGQQSWRADKSCRFASRSSAYIDLVTSFTQIVNVRDMVVQRDKYQIQIRLRLYSYPCSVCAHSIVTP